MITRILFLLFFFNFSAHAALLGNDKGNGGFTISCQKGPELKPQVQTLDLFEARDRGLRALAIQGLDRQQIVNQVLSRLKRLAPVRAEKYMQLASHFWDFAKIVEDSSEFENVRDEGVVYIPKNCQLLPTVIQKRSYFGTGISFFINGSVWGQLSPLDQAALIVHEIVYADFMQPTSGFTRSFVGLLFSEEFNQIRTPLQFHDLLARHEAPYFEQVGILIDMHRPYALLPNGFASHGFTYPGEFKVPGNGVLHYLSSETDFHESGYPKNLALDDSEANLYQVDCVGKLDLLNRDVGSIYLSQMGQVVLANFRISTSKIEGTCQNSQFQLSQDIGPRGVIQFDEGQQIAKTYGLELSFSSSGNPVTLKDEIEFSSSLFPLGGLFKQKTVLTLKNGEKFWALDDQVSFFRGTGKVKCAIAAQEQSLKGKFIQANEIHCFDLDDWR